MHHQFLNVHVYTKHKIWPNADINVGQISKYYKINMIKFVAPMLLG